MISHEKLKNFKARGSYIMFLNAWTEQNVQNILING